VHGLGSDSSRPYRKERKAIRSSGPQRVEAPRSTSAASQGPVDVPRMPPHTPLWGPSAPALVTLMEPTSTHTPHRRSPAFSRSVVFAQFADFALMQLFCGVFGVFEWFWRQSRVGAVWLRSCGGVRVRCGVGVCVGAGQWVVDCGGLGEGWGGSGTGGRAPLRVVAVALEVDPIDLYPGLGMLAPKRSRLGGPRYRAGRLRAALGVVLRAPCG